MLHPRQQANHGKNTSIENLSNMWLHLHIGNTHPNKHVHMHYQSKTIPQMHDLPLLTLQQLNTYGIMHEHMNA